MTWKTPLRSGGVTEVSLGAPLPIRFGDSVDYSLGRVRWAAGGARSKGDNCTQQLARATEKFVDAVVTQVLDESYPLPDREYLVVWMVWM